MSNISDLLTTTLCLGIILGAILQFLITIFLTKLKEANDLGLSRKKRFIRLRAGERAVRALEEWENKE